MFYKICGMTRQQDLDVAAELGFALCGFIFHAKAPEASQSGRRQLWKATA